MGLTRKKIQQQIHEKIATYLRHTYPPSQIKLLIEITEVRILSTRSVQVGIAAIAFDQRPIASDRLEKIVALLQSKNKSIKRLLGKTLGRQHLKFIPDIEFFPDMRTLVAFQRSKRVEKLLETIS